MAGIELDPEIMQEFITECGELLESLEGDLIDLESDNTDTEQINKIFRALHTIKGSASFLALDALVEIAHVAETALNCARNGEAVVDKAMMDLLLRAIDIIKQQMGEIESGSENLTRAEPDLVAALGAIGEGKGDENPDSPGTATPEPADSAKPRGPGGPRELALDESKADLLGPFVEDLESQLDKLSDQIEMLMDDAARPALGEQIEDLGRGLSATIDFFEFDSMLEFANTLVETASAASKAESVEMDQMMPRMRAVLNLLSRQKDGLGEGTIIEPPSGELLDRLRHVVETGKVDPDWQLPVDADDETVFRVDGVNSGDEGCGAIEEPSAGPSQPGDKSPDNPSQAAPAAKAKGRAPLVEKTLRVEVSRLESLMNLVGELVLQKNRICELGRRVTLENDVPQELSEPLELGGAGLDRITSEIQVAVMRTRMQPLDKLFGRYPRLIRDLSQKTGKDMRLVIEGGETEVDKQVIEELGDPLVHLLRNSADHGLEPIEDRIAAGKPAQGTITLRAAHQGNNAVISITDDGRGLPREKLGAKAVERGLVDEDELATMSDPDVYRFIFMPGFSTVDNAVSDLSGRGVGMDVVRTNIERLKGTVDIASTPGEGSTILITIPLTVAILPAMMVKVVDEAYAIPLSNITEIVRPDGEELATIIKERVIRLRGSVLPLLDATERFDVPGGEAGGGKLAVVLHAEEKSVGLLVTEVIGQQEIVIKPLDGLESTGPFSGATVRNDGGVSLIIDVAELIRAAA